MSAYDNEIYRGPPEMGTTLAQDTPSYGTDYLIIKPPKTTASQDIPATEEADRQESAPTEKKKSKVAKAMKLLASCTTAVLVTTTLMAPAKPAQHPVDLPVWSSFGPVHGEGAFSFSVAAENSQDCQVSIGGKSYCLIARREGLYLQWHETYDATEDGSGGGFYLCMDNKAEDWMMILDFNVNPIQKTEASEGLSQIQTDMGQVLYVRGFYVGSTEGLPPAQRIMDQLGDYLRIADMAYNDWDNVRIGETMYSETNERWNGIQTVNPWIENGDFRFQRICHTYEASYSPDSYICRHRVNGIDWRFYFSMEKGEMMIWAVPDQENIALGHAVDDLLKAYGVNMAFLEEISGGEALPQIQREIAAKLRRELMTIIEVYTVGSGLTYYYPLKEKFTAETLPQWPQVGMWSTSWNGQGYSCFPASVNGRSCQVNLNGEVLKIESMQENVFVFSQLSRSYEVHVDTPDYNGDGAVIQGDYYQICDFNIFLQDAANGWGIRLLISKYPWIDENGNAGAPYGTIQTEGGQTLYIINASTNSGGTSAEEWQWLWTLITERPHDLRITETQDLGWGKVQLGDSLISDTNANWNGMYTTKHGVIDPDKQNNLNWNISQIRYTDSVDMKYCTYIDGRQINGIEWAFYFKTSDETMNFPGNQYHTSTCELYAIPSVGEFCLELSVYSLLTTFSGYGEYWEAIQDPMCYDVWIYDAIDMVVADGLQFIYPLEK